MTKTYIYEMRVYGFLFHKTARSADEAKEKLARELAGRYKGKYASKTRIKSHIRLIKKY